MRDRALGSRARGGSDFLVLGYDDPLRIVLRRGHSAAHARLDPAGHRGVLRSDEAAVVDDPAVAAVSAARPATGIPARGLKRQAHIRIRWPRSTSGANLFIRCLKSFAY